MQRSIFQSIALHRPLFWHLALGLSGIVHVGGFLCIGKRAKLSWLSAGLRKRYDLKQRFVELGVGKDVECPSRFDRRGVVLSGDVSRSLYIIWWWGKCGRLQWLGYENSGGQGMLEDVSGKRIVARRLVEGNTGPSFTTWPSIDPCSDGRGAAPIHAVID